MEENQVQIPEGWSEESFGNLLNYEQPYKYTVDTTEYNDKSGIPVLTAGKSFLLGYTTEQHNVYKNTPVIIFDDFTTDSKFVDFPFKVKSSAMKFLKPKNSKEVDIKVIFGYIQNLKIRETGGDHKRRWISEFSKLKVVLPPYIEQTQIATILSKVDEAIAQTEQLIAKYTRIKMGLMQDLLTKGIDEHGNIRSEATHEFKDSPLGRIPIEWEVEALNSAIIIIDCKHVTPKYVEEGVPLIRPRNIKPTGITMEDVVYVTESDFKMLMDKHMPHFGDIIFTRNASFGVSSFVNEFTNFAIGQDVVIMTTKRTDIDSYYIFLLLNSILLTQILNKSAGSTFGRINLGLIRKLHTPIPNIKEQNRISNCIRKIDKNLENHDDTLSKLQSLKTGLMQDLLSGKVRVNHLIKETMKA